MILTNIRPFVKMGGYLHFFLQWEIRSFLRIENCDDDAYLIWDIKSDDNYLSSKDYYYSNIIIKLCELGVKTLITCKVKKLD